MYDGGKSDLWIDWLCDETELVITVVAGNGVIVGLCDVSIQRRQRRWAYIVRLRVEIS